MPTDTPLATYRIQFTSAFGFDAAAKYVPYLKQLGITHLYASPFLKARPGSAHGYDIVDHGCLNPEFGGEDAFARLSEALTASDLGLILDFVPNHMGVGGADNTVHLVGPEGVESWPRLSKQDVAERLADKIQQRLASA